ncbi:hypothetical protein AAVH_43122 [Aphelenchoides avenae]|nr:hypothetical protein AAVH_43122 [Aphelenchus avenae]
MVAVERCRTLQAHFTSAAPASDRFLRISLFLVPIAKAAGRELGREGLAVGSRVLGRVAEGEALKKAAINEVAQDHR